MSSVLTPPELQTAEPNATVSAGEPTLEGALPASGKLNSKLALALWCVVGALLAYGVIQTAIKAGALFG